MQQYVVLSALIQALFDIFSLLKRGNRVQRALLPYWITLVSWSSRCLLCRCARFCCWPPLQFISQASRACPALGMGIV